MILLLDRCPVYEEATEVVAPSGPVVVRAYQIVVWVGLSFRGALSRVFSAVLDTGHSHNFSIKQELLESWTGLHPREIPTIGHARLNKQLVELKGISVAIFPNTSGKRDVAQERSAYLLKLPEGVAVHRTSDPLAPRLPLLGMRALVKNRIRTIIDGSRLMVSLELD